MKQLDTQRRFEITDALADRRFRNVQARSGGGYASSLDHAHKCQDVVETPVPRSLLVDRLCDWHVFTLCGVGVNHGGDPVRLRVGHRHAVLHELLTVIHACLAPAPSSSTLHPRIMKTTRL